jgi:hypothetical protein
MEKVIRHPVRPGVKSPAETVYSPIHFISIIISSATFERLIVSITCFTDSTTYQLIHFSGHPYCVASYTYFNKQTQFTIFSHDLNLSMVEGQWILAYTPHSCPEEMRVEWQVPQQLEPF